MCAMVFSSGTLGSYVVCALACEVAFHEPALPLLSTCCLRAALAASDAALRARRCTPNSTIHVHEQCCTPSFDDVYSTQPSHVHSVLHSLRTTISFSFRLKPSRFSCSAICAYNAIKVTRITVECIIARRAPLGIGGSSLPSPFLAAFIQSFI